MGALAEPRRSPPFDRDGDCMSDVVRDMKREAEAAMALVSIMSDVLGDDETARSDLIEGQTDLFEVVAKCAHEIRQAEYQAQAAKSYIDDIKDRQARYERRAQRLRDAVCEILLAVGQKSIQTPVGVVTAGRVPPAVQIIDETELPARFWIKPPPPDPRIDKRAIGAALKGGEEVPGAQLDNGGYSLRIR